MYLKFYGLRENPFSLTSDPRFLYYSASHCEALAHMLYAIQQRKGLSLLVGDAGTGKTLLIRRVLQIVRTWGWVTPSVILNPSIREPEELIESILSGFGSTSDQSGLNSKHRALEMQLVELASSNKVPVLIVDESQALRRSLLEQIRLISNLEYRGQKLLQVLLIGQKELADKIAGPQFWALRQRIAMRCELKPFRCDEISAYLQIRMTRSGANSGKVFQNDACQGIFVYSAGIARLINTLADNSLLTGFVQQQRQICRKIVDDVAQHLRLDALETCVPTTNGHTLEAVGGMLAEAEKASQMLERFAGTLRVPVATLVPAQSGKGE